MGMKNIKINKWINPSVAGHFSAYTLIFLLQQKKLYTVLLVLLLENTETLYEGVIIGKKKKWASTKYFERELII